MSYCDCKPSVICLNLSIFQNKRVIYMCINSNMVHYIYNSGYCSLCVELKKKLRSLAKEKECDLVAEWSKSIINHLYWTAASSQNQSPDMMEEKWLSVCNHIQNIHEGHRNLFPKCLPGPLGTTRNWFKPCM